MTVHFEVDKLRRMARRGRDPAVHRLTLLDAALLLRTLLLMRLETAELRRVPERPSCFAVWSACAGSCRSAALPYEGLITTRGCSKVTVATRSRPVWGPRSTPRWLCT